MPGALAHPILILPERRRHERAPKAVRSEMTLERTRTGKVGAVELRFAQVIANAIRELVEVERSVVLADENEVVRVVAFIVLCFFASPLPPRLERRCDGIAELPKGARDRARDTLSRRGFAPLRYCP